MRIDSASGIDAAGKKSRAASWLSAQLVPQVVRGNVVDSPKRTTEAIDQGAGNAVGLEVLMPTRGFADDSRHECDRRGTFQVERDVCSHRVVESRCLALRPDIQLQEAIVGDAGARHDVVQRTESPSAQTGVEHEPVISQVVVVVADQDVEHHACEQLAVVRSNGRRMSMAAHGRGDVRVALDMGFALVASNERQRADEGQAQLECLTGSISYDSGRSR